MNHDYIGSLGCIPNEPKSKENKKDEPKRDPKIETTKAKEKFQAESRNKKLKQKIKIQKSKHKNQNKKLKQKI